MICPYCGKEMLDGKMVGGSTGIGWRMQENSEKTAPLLGLGGQFLGAALKSFYCRQCRMVIARPSEKAADQFEKQYQKYTAKQGKGEE